MTMSNTLENSLLELLFKATLFANVAINATSSPITNLYVSLHTSDPGEAGDQTTNEISYTNYARVAVARSGSGWTVTNNQVVPAAEIAFPASAGGAGGTVTHFGIGTDSSGTGRLLFSGTVTPNLAVASGVTPKLTPATAVTLE